MLLIGKYKLCFLSFEKPINLFLEIVSESVQIIHALGDLRDAFLNYFMFTLYESVLISEIPKMEFLFSLISFIVPYFNKSINQKD